MINIEEFHKNCGEILQLAVHVEANLEYFISDYFCEDTKKRLILNDSTLYNLTFERKLNIFNEICSAEEVDESTVKKVIDAIKYIQKIRNRVAHSQGMLNPSEEGIFLQKKKSILYKKDEIKITPQLVEEIQQKRKFIIDTVLNIEIDLRNPNRKLKDQKI